MCVTLHSAPVCSISECRCSRFLQAWCQQCLRERWAIGDQFSPSTWTPGPNSQSALHHHPSTEKISIYSTLHSLYINLIYNSSIPPLISYLLIIVCLLIDLKKMTFFSRHPPNFLISFYFIGRLLIALCPRLSSFQTRLILDIIYIYIDYNKSDCSAPLHYLPFSPPFLISASTSLSYSYFLHGKLCSRQQK